MQYPSGPACQTLIGPIKLFAHTQIPRGDGNVDCSTSDILYPWREQFSPGSHPFLTRVAISSVDQTRTRTGGGGTAVGVRGGTAINPARNVRRVRILYGCISKSGSGCGLERERERSIRVRMGQEQELVLPSPLEVQCYWHAYLLFFSPANVQCSCQNCCPQDATKQAPRIQVEAQH